MDKVVKDIAGINRQPHGVTHQSPHPAQQKKDVAQAAQHNRDMARIEKQHLRNLR